MRNDYMAVLQLNTKCRIGQGLGHDAFHLQGFFFSQFVAFSRLLRLANCADLAALLQRIKTPFQQLCCTNATIWPEPGRLRRLAGTGEFAGECVALHKLCAE